MCGCDLISLATREHIVTCVLRILRVILNSAFEIIQGYWNSKKSILAPLSLDSYIEQGAIKWLNPSSNFHLQINRDFVWRNTRIWYLGNYTVTIYYN